MGMAASQVRLLQLTSRKNTIGEQLESLSLQKTSLSREMRKVSQDYQNAINTKMLKWSNNSGVSYVDLSYANLMHPGSANQNTPYLITDSSGKIVVDSKYEKYAQMISPDGKSGGDWESNRTKILSEITGISTDKIEAAGTTSVAADSAADNVNKLQEEVDILKSKAQKKANTNDFVKMFGTTSLGRMGGNAGLGNSIYNWYNNTDSNGNTKMCWSLSSSKDTSKNMIKDFLNGIQKTMSQYLSDSDLEKFAEAVETVNSTYGNYVETAVAGNSGDKVGVSLDDSGDAKGYYVLNPNLIITDLLRNYEANGGSTYTSDSTGATSFLYFDKSSDAYKEYEAKQAELDAAKSEYKGAVQDKNQVLTANEESLIDFYDQLFTAIADNGWTCNPEVSDNDYLNQMLQNNQYTITTMKSATDKDGKEYYEYDSDIASNFSNVYQVNDTDAQNDAMVKYEYEKSIINEKESRIDARMQNLETEQSSINEMIKGIESVKNDNTERTFNIFT